jgi:hypothetical protein
VTREPEQDPVVQTPASKTAVKFSPNAKAALSAFQYTLDVLGKTPVPGIGAVTAALTQVVKGVQVRASSSRVIRTWMAIRILFALRKYRKSRQVGRS